jgi:hypothetical protein
MRTFSKFAAFFLLASLCAGTALADSTHPVHKQKKQKKVELRPLPSGPTGPVPQVSLDSMTAVAPEVTYDEGQLTIVAPNSTLGDILRAIHKETGAQMDIPPGATDRVVTRLGPGPAREIVAELLNGSRFNYVLLGSSQDMSMLTRIVLVAKTGVDAAPGQPTAIDAATPQPGIVAQQPDAEPSDDSADDNPEEPEQNAAEAEQPAQATPDQQGVKTPQQLLQEMQQRQLQFQQQQQQGQTNQPAGYPQPGAGVPMPQRPQQDQSQQQQ